MVERLRRATLAAWGLDRATAVVAAAASCDGGVVEGSGREGVLEVKVGCGWR